MPQHDKLFDSVITEATPLLQFTTDSTVSSTTTYPNYHGYESTHGPPEVDPNSVQTEPYHLSTSDKSQLLSRGINSTQC